ncbi:MAG: hypothetical protein ACYC0Q_06780 [Eubacteriales bacterium]
MAGEVKQKYSSDVELEVIYPTQMSNAGDLPSTPNIAVDGDVLGNSITFEQLEEAVLKKIQE